MVERVYRVPDVSCEHCIKAIKSELSTIPGVEQVDVDLATKQVTVRHADSVDESAILAGIEEAGYEVAA